MMNVSIDDLKPGMILAQPVSNHQGVLLLDAGAKITKKNIRIFKSWGITEIAVKGDLAESRVDAEDTPIRVRESVESELKAKFSDVLDDPVMNAIFNAACFCLTKSLPSNERENEHP